MNFIKFTLYSSYQPAPFFVLDEVDAALDNTNVARIANYIRQRSSDVFQFIVISLKGSLYERGNSLVGIFRDQDVNSSSTLTLDVSLTKGLKKHAIKCFGQEEVDRRTGKIPKTSGTKPLFSFFSSGAVERRFTHCHVHITMYGIPTVNGGVM